MKNIAVTLTVEPDRRSNWDGSLTVSGFVTTRTAMEVGQVLADALAGHTGAVVTVAIANHDEHGWSGMDAVEATALAVSRALTKP